MSLARTCVVAIIVVFFGQVPVGAQPMAVDAEIVLAVDASGSVDESELKVQRAGYVRALNHPDLIRAIRSGWRGRVAVAYFEYARQPSHIARLNWQVIASPQDAAGFAAAIDTLPPWSDYGTSISRAIAEAEALISDDAVSGDRRIIDISGDGPNNIGPPVAIARDRAVAAGLTINGLPVMIRPSNAYRQIDRYYLDCVIGGLGAFLLAARTPEEFDAVILRKLVLEISDVHPPAILRPAAFEPADCLAGERRRRGGQDPYFPGLYE